MPEAAALRSKPEQNAPVTPVRMATLWLSSRSNAMKALNSAAAISGLTALRASARSMVTMVMSPCLSLRIVMAPVSLF